MNAVTDLKCLSCGEQLERVRYFPRQLLTADDMGVEQEYFREKARRHNRYLHGWGVVCGCAVEPAPNAKTWTVRVCPGYVVGPQGDEILIDDCRDVDLKLGATPDPCTVRWPCPPVGPMPGENENKIIAQDDQAWCNAVQNIDPILKRLHTFPVPPCPECVIEPWVVLASAAFAGNLAVGDPKAPPMQISYNHRRTLLATQRIQTSVFCFP